MSVRQMINCGCAELTGVNRNTEKQLLAQLSAAKRLRYGLVIATTSSPQPKSVEDKLRHLGFKVKRRFLNPNTQNLVKVWFKDLSDSNVPGRVQGRFEAARPLLAEEDRVFLPLPRNAGN